MATGRPRAGPWLRARRGRRAHRRTVWAVHAWGRADPRTGRGTASRGAGGSCSAGASIEAGSRNQCLRRHLILRCSTGPSVLSRTCRSSTSAASPHSGQKVVSIIARPPRTSRARYQDRSATACPLIPGPPVEWVAVGRRSDLPTTTDALPGSTTARNGLVRAGCGVVARCGRPPSPLPCSSARWGDERRSDASS